MSWQDWKAFFAPIVILGENVSVGFFSKINSLVNWKRVTTYLPLFANATYYSLAQTFVVSYCSYLFKLG